MYKVLVVEDTLSIREEISDILFMEGYVVFLAENGEIGFELALKELPDLIVSDILMPVLNGFEMFDKLRNNDKTMAIPLIFLSAKAEKEDIRNGMNLGAEDYLTKPIDTEDLLNSIENKIKKKLIREQKNQNKTKQILERLQNQKTQLDTYSQIILEGLKPPQTDVSELLSWTQKELENSQIFEDTNRKINERWSALKSIESSSIDINTLVKSVIGEINELPHIRMVIQSELPILFANERLLEELFKNLLQNAVDYINRRIGLIEIECEITKEEYIFLIKYDYVRLNSKSHNDIFEEFQVIKASKSLGVGLNIVGKIITHYKGKIYRKSIPNKERIFYFHLPKTNNNE